MEPTAAARCSCCQMPSPAARRSSSATGAAAHQHRVRSRVERGTAGRGGARAPATTALAWLSWVAARPACSRLLRMSWDGATLGPVAPAQLAATLPSPQRGGMGSRQERPAARPPRLAGGLSPLSHLDPRLRLAQVVHCESNIVFPSALGLRPARQGKAGARGERRVGCPAAACPQEARTDICPNHLPPSGRLFGRHCRHHHDGPREHCQCGAWGGRGQIQPAARQAADGGGPALLCV